MCIINQCNIRLPGPEPLGETGTMMTHPLCAQCLHSCKQEETVRIIRCPKFQRAVSEEEFRELLDGLREAEEKANDLKKRSEALIRKALSRGNDGGSGDGGGVVS